MDSVSDVSPGVDLVLVPDAGDVGEATVCGGDEGAFGDEEGSGDGAALVVVFCDDGEGDVFVGGAETG